MPIKLKESATALATVCRQAEAACGPLPTKHAWAVDLLPNFLHLSGAKVGSAIAKSPAAFRPSTQCIEINGETFFDMTTNQQVAILVHEVGHAVRGEDDFEAEMFACEYGQQATLAAERAMHYGGSSGAEYAAMLSLWKTRGKAREAYDYWSNRKKAGLI